ncbi:hypothetical protein QVD17_28339 [Tagetes erecta]|uniref:Reverse transcriptase zinc-binding domain-containing protein n=1 Tax=Tagetes erecta TaxID=13708 RepID=A0AAD8NS43_TARER|nr:hypothetical protein QVD17_28339 [Tagetes erecta]
MMDLQDLECMIRDYNFRVGEDIWTWHVHASGLFTTKSCKEVLKLKGNDSCPSISINWLRLIPHNVLAFISKLDLDTIPVVLNLVQRGIANLLYSCTVCVVEPEDVNHLFIRCMLAREVWSKILFNGGSPTTIPVPRYVWCSELLRGLSV